MDPENTSLKTENTKFLISKNFPWLQKSNHFQYLEEHQECQLLVSQTYWGAGHVAIKYHKCHNSYWGSVNFLEQMLWEFLQSCWLVSIIFIFNLYLFNFLMFMCVGLSIYRCWGGQMRWSGLLELECIGNCKQPIAGARNGTLIVAEKPVLLTADLSLQPCIFWVI